jgi:hypothetical protein
LIHSVISIVRILGYNNARYIHKLGHDASVKVIESKNYGYRVDIWCKKGRSN